MNRTEQINDIVSRGVQLHGGDQEALTTFMQMEFRKLIANIHRAANNYFDKPQTAPLLKQLITFAACEFSTNYKDTIGECRDREAVEARFVMFHILHFTQGLSLKSTGRQFSNRDHSTVHHGLGMFDTLYKQDKSFREKANRCITFAAQTLYNNDNEDQQQQA